MHDCQLCKERFTLTRRRHHCRACGGVFCSTCSARQVLLSPAAMFGGAANAGALATPGGPAPASPGGAAAAPSMQRVCDTCYGKLATSAASASKRASLRREASTASTATLRREPSTASTASLRREPSTGGLSAAPASPTRPASVGTPTASGGGDSTPVA